MNQNQQRYAMKRVSEIEKERKEVLREKFTSNNKPVLSDKRKKQQITEGWADLTNSSTWGLDTPIGKCFRYDESESEAEFDQKGFDKAVRKLRKEVATVTDEIMLGDADNARKLLSELESTV